MEITITKSDRNGKTVITKTYNDAEADIIEKILNGQNITPDSRIEAFLKNGGTGGGGSGSSNNYEFFTEEELEEMFNNS